MLNSLVEVFLTFCEMLKAGLAFGIAKINNKIQKLDTPQSSSYTIGFAAPHPEEEEEEE